MLQTLALHVSFITFILVIVLRPEWCVCVCVCVCVYVCVCAGNIGDGMKTM